MFIKETCQVLDNQYVVAGSADIYWPPEYDHIELYNLKDESPLFTSLCAYPKTTGAKDVIACLEFNKTIPQVTLFVWNIAEGSKDEPKLKYKTVVEDLENIAPVNALAISDDGKTISVLGHSGASKVVKFIVYSSEDKTPLWVWGSKKNEYGTRLRMSKDGKVGGLFVDNEDEHRVYQIVLDLEAKKERYRGPVEHLTYEWSISPDGLYISQGHDTLVLRKWNGTTYQTVFSNKMPENTYIINSLVSSDGEMIVGLTTEEKLQVTLLYYNAAHKNSWSYKYGKSDSLMDLPWALSAVFESSDIYLVVGSWGNQTEENPQVRVFKIEHDVRWLWGEKGTTKPKPKEVVEEVEPIFEYVTAGSMMCADLSLDAKNGVLNVVAGGKANHCNIYDHGGDLYFFQLDLTV